VGDALPYLLLLVASLCASAFFSGVETGAYSVNRLRLAIRAERGEPRARVLLDELRNPNRWLATLLVLVFSLKLRWLPAIAHFSAARHALQTEQNREVTANTAPSGARDKPGAKRPRGQKAS
jgi:Mg2+/Co2+ transporter CorB